MTTLPPGNVIENRPCLWLHEGWRLARTVRSDPSGRT